MSHYRPFEGLAEQGRSFLDAGRQWDQPFGRHKLERVAARLIDEDRLAGGQCLMPFIKGEPPKRIDLLTFESFEKAQAAFNSPAFVAAGQTGEKYAKFRIYAVEGVPPR
jgi:hypothetical protein